MFFHPIRQSASQNISSLRPRLSVAGSPLGIFLTLRKVNPAKGRCLGGPEAARLMLGDDARNADGLPAVDRLYNLYHPFDPVGFRWVSLHS